MILLVTIGLGWFWYAYAESFALFLYGHAPREYSEALYQNGPAIFAALILLSLIVLAALAGMFEAQQRGDGLWNSPPVRRMIGLTAGASLYAALIPGVGLILQQRMEWGPAAACLMLIIAKMIFRPSKIVLGRATRPLRRFLSGLHVGKGGTARYSGLLDEWANPWRPGQVLLGASHYDPKWLVGIEDDRHIVTLATTRAGKGRSLIIPNLLTWPGSALVIDPKGQNACVTALVRGKGGKGIARYTILSAFAEFERRQLIQRTKEGLAAARQRGTRLGRPPKLNAMQLEMARERLTADNESVGAIAREFGVAPWTLTRALRRQQATKPFE